jgi:hypothetical protein
MWEPHNDNRRSPKIIEELKWHAGHWHKKPTRDHDTMFDTILTMMFDEREEEIKKLFVKVYRSPVDNIRVEETHVQQGMEAQSLTTIQHGGSYGNV